MKKIFITLVGLFLSLMGFAQRDTVKWVGVESKEAFTFKLTPPEITNFVEDEGKYYALLIAEQDYQDNSLDLKQTLIDAERLQKMLTEFYNFEPKNTFLLKNPTLSDINKEFELLAKKVSAIDNLLIFYAGHGEYDDRAQTGYWLPADAKKGDKTTWLANSALRDNIRAIQARHVLLITDACFSGSLFRGNDKLATLNPFGELHKLSSRKAMTSGALKLVPDQSVFIDYLVRRLGQNSGRYISAGRLFFSLQKKVLEESRGQTPQYGIIQNAGEDDGGEFIFVKKN
jgi:hypothetical protein